MLNVAVVVGRLTADPELRYTPNNVAVLSFTVACGRSYVKAGAERQTDFIDVVAWRSTAEFISKYFRKGNQIAVQGSIQTRSYTDSQGNKRKAVEIVADNVHFVDSKASQNSKSGNSYPYPTDAPAVQEPSSFTSGSVDDFAEVESDLDVPF